MMVTFDSLLAMKCKDKVLEQVNEFKNLGS